MKVSKETNVKFQAERVDNVYMLRNSKVTVSGLQLSSASKATVVKQSETMIVSSWDVQLYPEERLGTMRATRKFRRYSYDETNSHKSVWIKEIIG